MRIGLGKYLAFCLALFCGLSTAQIVTKTTPSGGSVGGASSLSNVGRLPRVTAAGTLGESGLLITTGGVIYPAADSTTAVQINKANGTTNVLTVDTTNGRLGIGTPSPAVALDIVGAIKTTSNVEIEASSLFYWTGRSLLASGADGKVRLSNNAGTDFEVLQFGGTTSSFPALKRSTTTVQARLADDSAGAAFNALRFDTSTNCASGASPAVCAAASSGAVALPAGGTTLTVNTTAVNAASRIQITENTTVGTELSVTCNTTVIRTYAVTTITAGTSFVITTSAAPVTNPACLSFLIVN